MIWFAAALSLTLAATYQVRFVHAPLSIARSTTKTASILALAALAAIVQAPFAIVLALLMSAAGDWALSRAGTVAFLAGILAFGAAQLLYANSFFPDLGQAVFAIRENREPAFLVLLAIGAAVAAALTGEHIVLRIGAGSYAVVLLLMAVAAWKTGLWPLRLGAGLFVLSDALIALSLFDPKCAPRLIPHAVWATYWPAQALLLTGALAL